MNAINLISLLNIGRLLCQENNGKWEFELDYKE